MRRNSMAVNMSNTSQVIADDLNVRLDYFENRVAFARLLFPAEAKLAMEMADHPTSDSSGNLREVDLNETPSVRSERLHEKLRALIKTVDMGQRFSPHCSEVLDMFLDDETDMADYFLEKGTPEEEKNKKRMRFMELKDDIQKAFCRDVAENQGQF
ncbi:putative NPR1/NIM1-like protein [Rosa chinensis]|uniref:Putative NPR1/NIM1-like protein n=1 Tax=Rosa chinensis TaxID=74649 RepID=A0A2P6S0E6_ROSCH|nr:BTB/POZ domain and ankyrin repeat-containing protein NPR1 [Rosa chinensis]PRQ52158.1 putative NPR1/NIM1-like protein [Rosa chinensis]